MGVWRSIGGLVTLRLVSSDVQTVLQLLARDGLVLYGVRQPDELSAEFAVLRKDYPAVKQIAQRRGDTLVLLQCSGVYWRVKALLHRPLLVSGMILMLLLAVMLPTRVLFVRVEGSTRIPSAKIIEAAENCGIHFWASRAQVRSERVKNQLLESIPELQWVGVNTTGCHASICVKERQERELKEDVYSVSRIVACRDGIVSTVVCTSGNVLCRPGEAVREGQTLISGFTDCGLSIRAERSQGEIFALTNREIRAVLPQCSDAKGNGCGSGCQISLVIGKKRINLWKDSGISCMSCVKIYEEKWVCLPGGFRLPVCIAVERRMCGTESGGAVSCGSDALEDYSRNYLSSQMLSGTILTKAEEITEEEACLVLTGQYACLEMIGRERSEEIVHGKDD